MLERVSAVGMVVGCVGEGISFGLAMGCVGEGISSGYGDGVYWTGY